MSSASACNRDARRRLLLGLEAGPNAFDHVEVVDGQGVPDAWRQRFLRAFFLRPLIDDLTGENLRIDGGDRIGQVEVLWALPWPLLADFRAQLKPPGALADSFSSVLAASDVEVDARIATLIEAWATHLSTGALLGIDWSARLAEGAQRAAFVARWRRLLTDPAFRHLIESDAQEWQIVEQILGDDVSDAARLLIVHTASWGDYSRYKMTLDIEGTGAPGAGYDAVLSSIEVFFKVECSRDVDCRAPADESVDVNDEPRIDYLARDYASFRRLMLDRLSVTMPQWRDRNAADVGMALVEVMAYAADQLSYYQDAVATEAYLHTARRRASIRRHARLVDYYVHEGANARAFVHLRVAESEGHGMLKPAGPWESSESSSTPDSAGPVRFLTRCPGVAATVSLPDYSGIYAHHRPEVFELMEATYLSEYHNAITIYDWGDPNYSLPEGATGAAFRVGDIGEPLRQPLRLRAGDFLIFEQIHDPEMGAGIADPARRHMVRLTGISPQASVDSQGRRAAPAAGEYRADRATGALYVEVEWAIEDALPFALAIAREVDGDERVGLAVARANMALVDHGRTIIDEVLAPVSRVTYRPMLAQYPVTHTAVRPESSHQPVKSARAMLLDREDRALAQVRLAENTHDFLSWSARFDLLGSDAQDRNFAVEVDDDGRAQLRFGDGQNGRRPIEGRTLRATYRVGNGRAGDIPAEAISHVVGAPVWVEHVSNPLPAIGGLDPEPLEQVRQLAPHAFRRQERAVTVEDYARLAERHPEVQRAVASRRWTGSWSTIFVSVDRIGGEEVDRAFEEKLVGFLERFRLAGDDVEIEPARMVPVEIQMSVCVEPGYYRDDVRRALLRRFSTQVFSDGSRGFFHPDNFSFGQPLYLSAVVAAAMGVAGVMSVNLDPRTSGEQNAFGARFAPRLEAYDAGKIEVSRQEVIRLDNDPNHREFGIIGFDFKGGR